MKIKALAVLPPLIFAGMAVAFWLGMQRDDPEALPSARAGQVAPELTLEPMPGEAGFDAETLRNPGAKLVNFWASWCAPCRVEHPHLAALAEEGVPIYGINYKDEPERALGFLRDLGNPFAAIAADASGRTALDWGVYGVPETYVLDGEGRIVLRFAGPITERVIDSQIRPAIAKANGN
ncbi:DsbE family thiol:disulfide interchange protein [Mesobaculum littorinae]|uniref:DsbE family thiol:disulfide interchange protein n=1 Tax=Mesobaculum littorinae TaxID=2486419 RepID=A0A438AIV5_9RHOB|nr:DsbE family thiol:disulfide interchange protein [Mesobaculum littorinae]RVV98640.1 DsbE family thiol:disulfide interchange protein [Mesobaculum littorinae]